MTSQTQTIVPADWQKRSIAELLDQGVLYIGDGYRAKLEELGPSGLPFARAGNIDGGFQFEGADRFPEHNLARVGNKVSQPGDVVFTSKGTVGRFALVRETTPRFVYSPQLCFWRVLRPDCIHPRFLFYWMSGREFYVQYKGVAGQTDMAEYVSLADQRRMHITLPSAEEQRAIAHTLGTLDDKIELNRRMSETLEEMARALFKSWFVDFDPVRAKAEGCQPYGMDAGTAALFPDSFQDSPLGKIPSGWSVRSLDEIAHFLNGLALQKYPPDGKESLPVVKIAQLRKGNTEGADQAAADIPPEYVIEDGDVLFSWSGSLEVVVWCGGRGALNQHLFKVTSKHYPKWFCYCWIREHLLDFQAIASGKATTMGHIQRHHLSEAKVLVPPTPLLQRMDEAMAPLFQRIEANSLESRTLTALRDALLPKLISGGIRLADVAEAAELVTAKAQPKVQTKRRAPAEFREAILIAALVRALASPKFPLGRKRYNKLAYLVHRRVGQDVQPKFLKKAAGPYSPWMRYRGPENIAVRKGYVKRALVGNRSGLVAASKVRAIEQYLPRYGLADALNWVVNSFKYHNNEQLELLTTVDFAALELVEGNKPVTVETVRAVIASEPNWVPKLNSKLFSNANIEKALEELGRHFPRDYRTGSA